MKKILSFILTIILVFASVAFAYAEDSNTYKVGDIIQFGSYPQSEVKDEILIAELNALAPEWDEWTSYGYYSGNGEAGSMVQGDWMRYVDIKHDGERYRGVKFTQYRPAKTYYKFSNIGTVQAENGYFIDEVYWFKFEPLDWIIIDPSDGFVICNTVIDSQAFSNIVYKKSNTDSRFAYYNDLSYSNFANDYKSSTIREWLNDSFYNSAFTYSEKEMIVYTCNNNKSIFNNTELSVFNNITNDKIFLASSEKQVNYREPYEVANGLIIFEDLSSFSLQQSTGSDYARCQGLSGWIDSEDSWDDMYRGLTNWWLSNSGASSLSSFYVYSTGWEFKGIDVTSCSIGVRPAIKICNHSYIYKYVEESCIDNAYEYYECENCGNIKDKKEFYGTAKQHEYKKNITPPTCTAQGFTTYTCECNDSYVADYVGTTPHSYASIITRPATHLSEGVRTYTCTACGDSYPEVIAKTKEHTYSVLNIVKPTCETEGYTTYACECGHTYNGDNKAATGHNFNGSKCSDCGYDKADSCSCNCHKSGFASFFWKITLFFNKLFKIKSKQMCACGVSHY